MKFLDYLLHAISRILKLPLIYLASKPKLISKIQYPSIDILIPVVEKDLDVLVHCIKSLREFSLNPIKNIFIVAPKNKNIEILCKDLSLKYINELDILPIELDRLKKSIEKKDKIGWFIQQLLKLNSDNIPNIGSNYLIFDADTLLLSKQIFLDSEKTILKFSDEFHILYRLTNSRILKFVNLSPVSYICHQMVFNKAILKELKSYIERKNNDDWVNVILKESVRNKYYFSEYELYSQYVLKNYRSRLKIQYWFNKNSNILKMKDKINISKRYLSISFHNYNRN